VSLIDRQAEAARATWMADDSRYPWHAVVRAVLAVKAQTPREQLIAVLKTHPNLSVYGIDLKAALLGEDES
jgi:hypothetical protein